MKRGRIFQLRNRKQIKIFIIFLKSTQYCDYARLLFWQEMFPSDYHSAIQGRGQKEAWEALCK